MLVLHGIGDDDRAALFALHLRIPDDSSHRPSQGTRPRSCPAAREEFGDAAGPRYNSKGAVSASHRAMDRVRWSAAVVGDVDGAAGSAVVASSSGSQSPSDAGCTLSVAL